MPSTWTWWSSVLPLLNLLILLNAGCVGDINAPLAASGLNHTNSAVLADTLPPNHRETVIVVPRPPIEGQPLPAMPDHVPDGRFVGIAISGGGSRASNFAAATLLELDRLGWLDHADYLSVVSGGSFPAAIYCTASGDNWNEPRLRRALGEDLTSVFLAGFLVQSPILLATDRDRGDVFFEILNRRFFQPGGRTLTYADLRGDRPRLLINAANVANGSRFIFCNESFDRLASDLASLPLGRAVAATAAHPALFSPVAIRDYSASSRTYLHLADGGIADNLGIRTLYETYRAHLEQASRRSDPVYPRGAVFIVIDARVQSENRIESKPDLSLLRSLVAGLSVSATSLVSGVSDATLAEIVLDASSSEESVGEVRRRVGELKDNGFTRFVDRSGRPVVLLHVSLTRLGQLDDPLARELYERAMEISTDLRITREQQDTCWNAARVLARELLEPVLRELEPGTSPPGP